MIDYNQYKLDGSRKYIPPLIASGLFKIEWVLCVKEVNEQQESALIQNIDNSSHVNCIGTIEKIIDDYTFVCFLDILGKVTVELEEANNVIHEKMKVQFTGNLAFEINQ